MIRDVFQTVSTNVREVPTRLAQFKGQAEDLSKQVLGQAGGLSKQAQAWVKARAWEVQTTSEDNLWTLNLEALATAGKLVERAGAVPVLDRVGGNAKELLATWEKATLAPPIAGYEDANVREIVGGLHALDRLGLLRVRHWETAHKARKTVLDAVERELERRSRWASEA